MTDHPILMNSEMVRAVLDGRKDMTRRVIKPQPKIDPRTGMASSPSGDWFHISDFVRYYKCPFGKIGNFLWVRETWRPAWAVNVGGISGPGIRYKADNKAFGRVDSPCKNGIEGKAWKPSIFMPRYACRIKLEVTGIRCERLWEITEDDAVREGARTTVHPDYGSTVSAKFNFMNLWNDINSKRGFGWLKNPHVWIITFKRVEE